MFGEFMGTLILVLLGNGVVANVVLEKTKGNGGGWIVITTGWALAVMCGVFVSVACGGEGHLNPAVTLATAAITGDFSKLAPYAVAQLLGAIAGAVLVWLHYLPHWRVTADADSKRACFCTAPAIRSTGANLISEIIGTFVLVFVASAIGSKIVSSTGPAAGIGPYLVGSVVWGIGLGLGGTTGYAINTVRDLGPRIAYSFLPIPNKEGSKWEYAAIPIIGPLIGGTIAGLAIRLIGF